MRLAVIEAFAEDYERDKSAIVQQRKGNVFRTSPSEWVGALQAIDESAFADSSADAMKDQLFRQDLVEELYCLRALRLLLYDHVDVQLRQAPFDPLQIIRCHSDTPRP